MVLWDKDVLTVLFSSSKFGEEEISGEKFMFSSELEKMLEIYASQIEISSSAK